MEKIVRLYCLCISNCIIVALLFVCISIFPEISKMDL